MSSQILNVFESFNARSLAPEQVARTFIPPISFADLAARCHSTVIGPRGSGKTSVLKMLQPNALESWNTEEGERYRSRIDYTGIFIPTDISWNKQTLAIVDGLTPAAMKLFRGAAFTTHVLHELIDVITWRVDDTRSSLQTPFRRVSITTSAQRSIVKQLSLSWGLNPATETFLGLKHSLASRLVEVWSLAQRVSLLGLGEKTLPNWITLEFLSCCNQAVELFDDAVGERHSRWALLFDELELAPEWIMQGLLTALRSVAEKFIFKLAVSPFNERYDLLKSAIQAMPGQDFNEIRLWHANKEDGFEFSERLFLSVCRDYEVSARSTMEIFGRSFLDVDEKSPASYVKGSRQYKALKRAIKSDPSFSRHWTSTGLDIDKLDKLTEDEQAAKVRKIYPLIVVRNFFRVPAQSLQATHQIRKSRKTMELYSGSSSLLAVSEANPRWIIGLTRLLLSNRPAIPINRGTQARQIDSTIHKFRARLKAVSLNATSSISRARTLLDLIDRIGTYFQKSTIIDDFHSQPALTFTVDSNASKELLIAVGRGINAGAFVFVPDKSSVGILNDVKGKRFRLSYLLAPYYRLPLRLGESISLVRILSNRDYSDSAQTEFLPL